MPEPPKAESPPPSPERYWLELTPESSDRAWAAVLVLCDSGTRVRFDHPLALLRFLARHSYADRRRGLR